MSPASSAERVGRSTLSPELRERALEAASEMGDALAAETPGDDPSLSRGAAGRAVTLAYLARDLDRPDLIAPASEAIAAAASALAEQRMSVGLMQGFTGIAWAIAHLGEAQLLDVPEGLDAIDAALDSALERTPWPGNYDLVSGLTGIGVYGLERGDEGRGLVERVVAGLEQLAEHTETGVTWFTRPELLPAQARSRVPGGYYNVGVAHGVPGVIAFLARAHEAGAAGAGALLAGAVAWLLANRLPPGGDSRWPYFVGPDIEPGPARLAWCYGAPGIAFSLHAAANASGSDTLGLEESSAWDEVAVRAAIAGGVQGISLCHGAAGLAHLLQRANGSTGREDLASAAALWIDRTLEARRPGTGLAGYTVWDPDVDEESGDLQGPGLLAGLAGVALALSAAATGNDAGWDRMLLIG
jgi:class I lanthipeptide synthase